MDKQMKYILIAYKPNSAHYCRGCHMASYSSELQYHENLDEENLVILMADYYLKNELDMDTGEDGYVILIIRDSDIIYDSDTGHNDEADEILLKARELAKEMIADEKESRELVEKERRLREIKEAEQREKAELDRLKRKYNVSP